MRALTPSDEQDAFVDAGAAGKNVAGEAGAGTGKTTTGMLMTRQMRGRGLYAAFNKSVADEARGKFPRHVDCRTVHSLAFRQVGVRFEQRLNGARQPAREVARLLKIRQGIPLGGPNVLQPTQMARLATEGVARFCRTMDDQPDWWHIPPLALIEDDELNNHVRGQLVPYARQIWEDLQLDDQHGGGKFRFTHDHYLRIFVMGRPSLPYDFIIADEAQDLDPLVMALMMGQRNHAQLIAIGDANQAIYGWRGSMDALTQWPAEVRLRLTESRRFGQTIADEANRWLSLLGSDMRLTGIGGPSAIERITDWPDVVLCRTNATAMAGAINALKAGKVVALVGGGDQIRRLAEAAIELKDGRGTSHPELCVFLHWGEVQDYVENEKDGSDLKVAVKLIDEYGPDEIIRAVGRLAPDKPSKGQHWTAPDVTVSTAHKAKGLQWSRVRVADDFTEPGFDDDGHLKPVPAADAMLAYVTVTRAEKVLDRGGLAWIDQYLTPLAAAA